MKVCIKDKPHSVKTFGGVGQRVTHPSALGSGKLSTYAVGALPPQDTSHPPPHPLVHIA